MTWSDRVKERTWKWWYFWPLKKKKTLKKEWHGKASIVFGVYPEVLDCSSQLVCGLTITIHLFHPRLSPHRTASSCSQLGSCQEGGREVGGEVTLHNLESASTCCNSTTVSVDYHILVVLLHSHNWPFLNSPFLADSGRWEKYERDLR